MDETVSARALRDSEELHRITLINMSDAVFITDDDGVFTYICPNVDVIFGYAQEDVRGMQRISRLLGRELVARGAPVADGEVRNIEHEIETKHGARRVVLTHIKQVAIKGGTVLYVCRDITERKQAEQQLRRNEERLTLALDAASMGTWDWHVPTGEMNWSPETHRIFGDLTAERRPSFDAFIDLLHPMDRDRVSQTMTDAMDRGASYETDFRVRGFDRIERWVMGKGKAWRNGKPLRMSGVFVDFTERHRVEQELRELGGRLIDAHEQERRRLARELHDDVVQRVTVLAAELGTMQRALASPAPGINESLGKLSTQAKAIGSELRRLSYQLHPASLEHAGLEGSIRGHCRELSESQHLDIQVEIVDLPARVAPELALCLYRVTQEALQNVVKHSGATRAIVTLIGAGHEMFLSVVDGGAGFQVEAAQGKGTLGLVSMRERARLVQGQLIVTSRPGGGTRVELRVPLPAR